MRLRILGCSGGIGSDLGLISMRFNTARIQSSAPAVLDDGRCAAPPQFNYYNKINGLYFIVTDSAVPDEAHDLAITAKHRCPSLFADELARPGQDSTISVTHFKPREAELIMEQNASCVPQRRARMLEQKQHFES